MDKIEGGQVMADGWVILKIQLIPSEIDVISGDDVV